MSRRVRSESELRRSVEEILNARVSDQAWQIVVKTRAVSEVLQGENSLEWLAKELQQFMNILGSQPRMTPEFITPGRRQRRGKAVEGRREALSKALAAIARQSEEVLSFRSKILGGRTLQFQEVETWIQEHRQDATYPHALLVRIKRDSNLFDRSGRQHKGCLCPVEPDEIEGPAPVDGLFYAKPGSSRADCVPVARDGVLRVVYEVSKALAGRFRWEEAQATVFLLADITPLITTQNVQLSPAPFMKLPYGDHLWPLSCLTRLTLTIDPMMTPRELSQYYAKLRAKLLDGKLRAQSAKHLKLAAFAVEHPALDKAAMGEWARRFPKWKYPRVSLFARDAKMARDRLLHQSAVDLWGRLPSQA